MRVSWQTENEVDMVGFNVLRSEGDSMFSRVNEELLPARRAGSESGSDYAYLDAGAAGVYCVLVQAGSIEARWLLPRHTGVYRCKWLTVLCTCPWFCGAHSALIAR